MNEQRAIWKAGIIIAVMMCLLSGSIKSYAAETKVTTYSDLEPQTEYLFALVKSTDVSDILSPDNLLYIGQQTTDEKGEVTFSYISRENDDNATKLLVGMTGIEILQEDIMVSQLIANGKVQNPAIVVIHEGITLVEGKDYQIVGTTSASEAGEYYFTVVGIGGYRGIVTSSFVIKENASVSEGKTNLKSVTNTAGAISIQWSKVSGADGYYVYRKTGTSGKWKKVKTLSGGSTTKWKDKNVKNGIRYSYRVCSYCKDTTSTNSNSKTIYYLSKSEIKSIQRKDDAKVIISYVANKKASGYQLQYSMSKKFTKAKTIMVKDKAKTSISVKGLKKGKTYYVRIRSYKKAGGRTYYSNWVKKEVKNL